MRVPYIPKELLHIILEYDGRIKYRNGKYTTIIDKNDERYNIITPLIRKKTEILKKITVPGRSFNFQFGFDTIYTIALTQIGFNADIFEMCYYDVRNDDWKQFRTYM